MKISSIIFILLVTTVADALGVVVIWNVPYFYNKLYVITSSNIVQPIWIATYILFFLMTLEIWWIAFLSGVIVGGKKEI